MLNLLAKITQKGHSQLIICYNRNNKKAHLMEYSQKNFQMSSKRWERFKKYKIVWKKNKNYLLVMNTSFSMQQHQLLYSIRKIKICNL
jgi:hypothetical protein